MVVQHNLRAMNSNRMLGLTAASQSKSTEKLSSGYKINRAADDAAGLSISEKMRKQIRGLTQASANAQDGISAVQTAEGALTEVHDMLQRMNELAVKSANGTNSENDRSYIQNEIDQLVTEIDRVAETTKFNETYLLRGNAEGKLAGDVTLSVAGKDAKAVKGATLQAGDVVLGKVTVEKDPGSTYAAATVDAEKLAKSTGTIATKLNEAASNGTVTLTYSNVDSAFKMGGAVVSAKELEDAGIRVGTLGAGNDAQTIVLNKKFVANEKLAEKNISYAGGNTATELKSINVGDDVKATVKVNGDVATLVAYDETYVPDALKVDLHVGADSTSNNKIEMGIVAMSAKSIGVNDLKVDGKDSTNADKAINTIASAIQKVSTQRSSLGAIQNRLEHTINNLDNVVENTTAAESAIRDTDMASEMVKYSNNNILAQAGQAMLAQANQANQGVLSLLG